MEYCMIGSLAIGYISSMLTMVYTVIELDRCARENLHDNIGQALMGAHLLFAMVFVGQLIPICPSSCKREEYEALLPREGTGVVLAAKEFKAGLCLFTALASAHVVVAILSMIMCPPHPSSPANFSASF